MSKLETRIIFDRWKIKKLVTWHNFLVFFVFWFLSTHKKIKNTIFKNCLADILGSWGVDYKTYAVLTMLTAA